MIREQLKQYLTWELDARTGETLPQVGVGTPTATALQWITAEKGRGLYFKQATSKIDMGAVDPIGTGNVTVVALIKPDSLGATNGRIIDNGKAIFYIAANKLGFCSDGATATVLSAANSLNYGQSSVVAVTRAATTSITNFFINGIQSGTRNQYGGIIAAGSTNTLIGNQNASARNFDGLIYYIAIYNAILTEQQIAQISDELMTEKTITLPFQRTQSDVNLLVDGDMEWSGTSWYNAGASATLSKQTITPYKGKQCLRVAYDSVNNPSAIYISPLVIGKYYRVTGMARSGDGTAQPRVSNGATSIWTGTTSTAWQKFDVVTLAIATDIRLYGVVSANGLYSEFDDIKVVEVPALTSYQPISYDAYYDNSGVGWNRSFANETAGMLSNTGFRIISGSWQVENQGDADERKKQITCKSAGVASIPLSVPYGYWKFDLYKGADGNTARVIFVANTPNTFDTAPQNGYYLYFASSESVGVSSIANGTPTQRMVSAASYISTTGWYSIIIKRYPTGVFYTYIKGGTQFPTWTLISVAGGSGTNPFTNNTYVTSSYINFQFGTNDAIKNMEFSPDFNKLLIANQI